LRLKLGPLELCTDTPAMTAAAAVHNDPIAYPDYLGFDAFETDRQSLRAA
jgi:hypothetical protein